MGTTYKVPSAVLSLRREYQHNGTILLSKRKEKGVEVSGFQFIGT